MSFKSYMVKEKLSPLTIGSYLTAVYCQIRPATAGKERIQEDALE